MFGRLRHEVPHPGRMLLGTVDHDLVVQEEHELCVQAGVVQTLSDVSQPRERPLGGRALDHEVPGEPAVTARGLGGPALAGLGVRGALHLEPFRPGNG